MDVLLQSSLNEDWKLVEKTAHRMKSALRGMGIKVAAIKVNQVEDMASIKPIDPIIHIYISELDDMIKAILKQLKEDYPDSIVPK